MGTTQDLLGMIAALREQLEQARALAQDATSVATVLDRRHEGDPLHHLRQRVSAGTRQQERLQQAVRGVRHELGSGDAGPQLPPHLTRRAVGLLRQVRDVVLRLKSYADEPLFGADEADPVQAYYQDTVLLADLVLRTLQTLPEDPDLQLRFCAGADVTLTAIGQRAHTLDGLVRRRRAEGELIDELSRLLRQTHDGTLDDATPYFALAESLVRAAQEGEPVELGVQADGEPARRVAAHSLSVARLCAFAGRHDPQWRNALLRPVAAALAHDVGMLAVPAELLDRAGPLAEQELGVVERHCRAGAQALGLLGSVPTWLVEAARHHHERLDGSGYPAGLDAGQLDPLVRLLAACDVYAALGAARPYRPAADTRAALTELLRLAQAGTLDGPSVRAVAVLGYYPAGTAVELTNGASGLVLGGRVDVDRLEESARPVIALLTDGKGIPYPHPHHLDLSLCEGVAVLRSLAPADRRARFGAAYPQWS